MTNREFFVAVVNANLNDEMTSKANELINAIDLKNSKAQAKRVEKAKEDEPLYNAVIDFVKSNENSLAKDIAETLNISTSKAVSLANKLVENGTLSVARIKVPKVGERNAYSIVG